MSCNTSSLQSFKPWNSSSQYNAYMMTEFKVNIDLEQQVIKRDIRSIEVKLSQVREAKDVLQALKRKVEIAKRLMKVAQSQEDKEAKERKEREVNEDARRISAEFKYYVRGQWIQKQEDEATQQRDIQIFQEVKILCIVYPTLKQPFDYNYINRRLTQNIRAASAVFRSHYFFIFPIGEQHWFQHFLLFKEANIQRHLPEVQIEWARITQFVCEIFDLTKVQSLPGVLCEPERFVRSSLSKQPIRIPIEHILTEHSVKTIRDGFLADLPVLFHNLLTDTALQKKSLEVDRNILLNPMEAFTLYFIRSIASLKEPVQPFYNHNLLQLSLENKNQDSMTSNLKGFIKQKLNDSIMSFLRPYKDNDDVDNQKVLETERVLTQSRIDLSRIQIIGMARVLDRLLEERYVEVYQRRGKNHFACETFLNSIQEYIMNPVTMKLSSQQDSGQSLHQGSGAYQRNHYSKIDARGSLSTEFLTTSHLEALFTTVALLQQRKYLFAEALTSHSPLSYGNIGKTVSQNNSAVKGVGTSATPQVIAERREQFVSDPDTNMLLDMKLNLYCYLKGMFKEVSRSSSNDPLGSTFRANRVSDVAMLWLQILRPWYQSQDFVYLATAQYERDPKSALFDAKGNLNIDVYSILSHNSISSLSIPKDFFAIENLEEREKERDQWIAYVREMSIFYFDIFVDYVQSLISQGSYTVDDAVVFSIVLEFFGVREGDLADADEIGETSIKYLLDGLIPMEHFMDIKTHTYQQPHVDPRLLNRTHAFTYDFNQQLLKAYQKLRAYNYDSVPGGRNGQDDQLGVQVSELLEGTERNIMGLMMGLSSYERHREDFNKFGSDRNQSAAKKLTFASRHQTTLKRPTTIYGRDEDHKLTVPESTSRIENAHSLVNMTQQRFAHQNTFRTPKLNEDQFHLRSDMLTSDRKIPLFNAHPDELSRRIQPRQNDALTKTRNKSLVESKSQRLMKTSLYQGNEWDRILGSDEYRVLYYLFKLIAYGIDRVMRVQPNGGQPQCQVLRRFASVYSFMQLVIVVVIVYGMLCLYLG